MLSEAVYNELVRDIEEQKKVEKLADIVMMIASGLWRALLYVAKYRIL